MAKIKGDVKVELVKSSKVLKTINKGYSIEVEVNSEIKYGLDKLGDDTFNLILGKNNFFQPIVASLIGMIPSCASSVVLAEANIKGAISLGDLVLDLCANTGYGILIILKELDLKKSLKIIFIIQFISITVGEIIFFLGR